jgi:hypothetical protein
MKGMSSSSPSSSTLLPIFAFLDGGIANEAFCFSLPYYHPLMCPLNLNFRPSRMETSLVLLEFLLQRSNLPLIGCLFRLQLAVLLVGLVQSACIVPRGIICTINFARSTLLILTFQVLDQFLVSCIFSNRTAPLLLHTFQ